MLKPRDLGPGAATRTFLEAMRAGRLHLGRFVLDALDGSIVDCQAERGRTPLMFAVALQDPAWRLAFARMLLERGATVNLRDDAGRSALSLACERGHLDATQLLVQFGADPDAVDARGWSPLMYAASAGRTAVVEWLLRAFRRLGQLCLERADRGGRTALQLAASGGHGQCVRALRAAGALILTLPEQPPALSAAAATLSSAHVAGGRRRSEDETEEAMRQQRLSHDSAPSKQSSEVGPGPQSLRARPLVRRATAPDCQSLLGC
ncbi:ankyrin repeat domain-containing protein 63 [Heteronotia binoei]|uniref:ankyrin repeat domain-containing protein 63 n=1 Tax=Heteronotia binoei TaxID=13085 RepID=UPI0029310FE2|nr:ankyrin repeat domain-containing protein 63 [Heteronotia binoei]